MLGSIMSGWNRSMILVGGYCRVQILGERRFLGKLQKYIENFFLQVDGFGIYFLVMYF